MAEQITVPSKKRGDRWIIIVNVTGMSDSVADYTWHAHVRAVEGGDPITEFTVTPSGTSILIMDLAPTGSALMKTGYKTDLVAEEMEDTWLEITWGDVQLDYTDE